MYKKMSFLTLACLVAAIGFAAAQGVAAPAPTYVSHETVNNCAKAMPFTATPEYRVTCNVRTAAGVPEVHPKDTDIFIFTEGETTFMVGGTLIMIDGKPGNIEGGQTHKLVKGDIMVVPAGVPHWFKEVPKSSHHILVKSFLK